MALKIEQIEAQSITPIWSLDKMPDDVEQPDRNCLKGLRAWGNASSRQLLLCEVGKTELAHG